LDVNCLERQIKPGDWPHLQMIRVWPKDIHDDRLGAMHGLLHLTKLQNLTLWACGLSREAISQIKPGNWSHLQFLTSGGNDFSDNPMGAIKELLHLTSLQYLDV